MLRSLGGSVEVVEKVEGDGGGKVSWRLVRRGGGKARDTVQSHIPLTPGIAVLAEG